MIVKIALCGICVCIISSVLHQYNKSFVIFIELVFLSAVVTYIFKDVFVGLKSITDLYELNSAESKIITCLIKGSVVCVLTKLACDISYESNNIIVGDIIELSGRIILMIISLPFIESVVKTAISFAR